MKSLLVLALLVGCSARETNAPRVRIAAAADLAKAFDEVGRAFKTKTGITPELSFGSSGLLARQIAQGAPYFLFAAANKSFTEQAVKSGKCDASTFRLYARGRIVVWTPKGKPAPATLADLAQPAFGRIALANPDHAPYGVAARQALQKVGIYDQLKDRIVLGENVLATLTYARDGNADAAIVARSLALVADGGTFLEIDAALHDPLDQALVVCGTGPEADAARQFAAYLASDEGREIMTRYGFVLPEAP